MPKRISTILFFISIFSRILSQDQSRMQGRAVEMFPYPYGHFNFVQPRFDQLNLKDGKYLNSYIVRATKTFGSFYHLRTELPLANTNTSGENVFGLADMKVRLMHATTFTKQMYLGYGAELTLPTATDASLGSGKWQARPMAGLIYFLGSPEHISGTAYFSVDYRFDFAGQSDRSSISVLGISPNIDYWAKKWYIGYYSTWYYDFHSEIWDIPLDLEFGYAIYPGFMLSFEYIQPLLKKRTYNNEYAIKLRYMFH